MTFISATIASATASSEVPNPRRIFSPVRPLASLRNGCRNPIDHPGRLDRVLLAVYESLFIVTPPLSL